MLVKKGFCPVSNSIKKVADQVFLCLVMDEILMEKTVCFRLCPQVSGCKVFATPEALGIVFYKDVLCNGTCSLTGLCIKYGGTNGKDPKTANGKQSPEVI